MLPLIFSKSKTRRKNRSCINKLFTMLFPKMKSINIGLFFELNVISLMWLLLFLWRLLQITYLRNLFQHFYYFYIPIIKCELDIFILMIFLSHVNETDINKLIFDRISAQNDLYQNAFDLLLLFFCDALSWLFQFIE